MAVPGGGRFSLVILALFGFLSHVAAFLCGQFSYSKPSPSAVLWTILIDIQFFKYSTYPDDVFHGPFLSSLLLMMLMLLLLLLLMLLLCFRHRKEEAERQREILQAEMRKVRGKKTLPIPYHEKIIAVRPFLSRNFCTIWMLLIWQPHNLSVTDYPFLDEWGKYTRRLVRPKSCAKWFKEKKKGNPAIFLETGNNTITRHKNLNWALHKATAASSQRLTTTK